MWTSAPTGSPCRTLRPKMALLQFMNAGRDRSAVPASVHCDHLIQADMGADKDLPTANSANREVYDFLSSVSNRYGIGFGYRGVFGLSDPEPCHYPRLLRWLESPRWRVPQG